MHRTIVWTLLLMCAVWPARSQSPQPEPKFEIADVHASPKRPNPFARNRPVRGSRYEVSDASMLDLIRIAYSFRADKILGGPSWLEMERFDVIAKVPPQTTPELRKSMLQSLLADRFKLVVHKETKPLPIYALRVGKKLQLKEAAGSEEPGCRPQTASGAAPEGAVRIMTINPGSGPVTIDLGPGMTIRYVCRNITMAAFAAGLRSMEGVDISFDDVLDETGLKGSWNFDVKWSMAFGLPMGGAGGRITVFDALEKQLGLKLEQKQVPTDVLVVDSVNEKPTPNPPGVAEALPPIAPPAEFEVASIKPADPGQRMSTFGIQPGGRLNARGMDLRFLIIRAFGTNNSEAVAGIPDWANSARFDIVAEAPMPPDAPPLDMESAAPMIRALLVDRFKMTYHTENRPVSAYSLAAAKPKMKPADPASRAWCRGKAAPLGSPQGSRTLSCQNITMEQFADRLQNMAPELSWPVLDATELTGGWDLSLTFSRFAGRMGRGGRGGDGLSASDPTGAATLFEAMEKQLGLKLQMHKRTMPVVVIDHIEQKPTEN